MAEASSLPTVRGRDERVDVLGLKVSTLDRRELLERISQSVASRERLDISFVNPDYATRAARDPGLRGRMNSFDILLPDGWGIVYAMRLRGARGVTRQANDDIGPDVFSLSARHGWRNFLFGSAPGVAEEAALTLTERFPGFTVAGTLHGYFDAQRGHPGSYEARDVDMIIDRVNAAAPDILWVGVPTPLQQDFVTENRERIAAPVIITGGSYLDHLAHGLDWFPAWTYKLRVGWLWRLSREPKRLWRRYSLGLLDYSWLVATSMLAGRRDERSAPLHEARG